MALTGKVKWNCEGKKTPVTRQRVNNSQMLPKEQYLVHSHTYYSNILVQLFLGILDAKKDFKNYKLDKCDLCNNRKLKIDINLLK